MKKIPTIFLRDPENMKHVLPEPNPACAWVFAGEGYPTAKVDGICVKLDDDGWWVRREVKPGKQPPPNWIEVDADPVTGKRQGWEPIGQSAFAKYLVAAAELLLSKYAFLELPEQSDGTGISESPIWIIGPAYVGVIAYAHGIGIDKPGPDAPRIVIADEDAEAVAAAILAAHKTPLEER